MYPSAPHPVTGRRQLQHLAFEVVSTQRINNAGSKAAKLAGRGVRRVFAIDLQRNHVLEWSTSHGCSRKLPEGGEITKRNPVVTRYRAEGEAKGRAEGSTEGKAVALLVVLDPHGIAIDAVSRRRILAERDPARLDRWLVRAARCRTIADVLAVR